MATVKKIIVDGARSLYRVAVDQYQDPLDFIALMQANTLESPFIIQPQTIVVPPNPTNVGGKPNQPTGKGTGVVQKEITYPFTTTTNVDESTVYQFLFGEVYSNTTGRGRIVTSVDGTEVFAGSNARLTDKLNNHWTLVNVTTVTDPLAPTDIPTTPVATPPGTVLDNTTTITSSSVGLTWAQPVSGTLPFTYQVFYSLHNANQWIPGPATTNLTASVDNLQSNTFYDFYVIASNFAGSSNTKSIVSATTLFALLGTISGITFTNISQTALTINWVAPSGTPPFTYQINYRLATTSIWTSLGTTNSVTFNVSGLVINTHYEFQIIPTDGSGATNLSQAIVQVATLPVQTNLLISNATATSSATAILIGSYALVARDGSQIVARNGDIIFNRNII